MRSFVTVCAVLCVVLAASFASAAASGQVSQNSLSKMGLTGLQPMSDLEGTQVRGKFAVVAGNSYAQGGTANVYTTSYNSYAAVGYHFAAGASLSFVLAGGGAVSGGGAIAVSH